LSGYDQGSKASRRAVLKDVEKQIGKRPAQLKAFELPDTMVIVWDIYCMLSPNFSLQELSAYCDLTGYQLSPNQVDLLCRINKASYG
jgi:hypothetical protein